MATNINWELYRSFLAVLTAGSLSGAARVLGLSQPTVGRHVAELELALGAALFTRSPGGLRPTDVALALRDHVASMESAAAAIERVVTGDAARVAGTVRVTASEVIGVEVLPPIVEQLCRRHPALKIELVLTSEVQDLLRREADIAVRMTPPRQEQLVAKHVGGIEVGLHAHERYLRRCGEPRRVDELASHALIGFDRETAFIRAAARELPGMARETFSIRTDSDLAQLALIRAGAGIGFCQARIAARDGLLRRVLPQVSMVLQTWITMHEDLRHLAPYRATFDALVQGIAEHASP